MFRRRAWGKIGKDDTRQDMKGEHVVGYQNEAMRQNLK